jgi:hypothetical protein
MLIFRALPNGGGRLVPVDKKSQGAKSRSRPAPVRAQRTAISFPSI